MHQRIKSEFLMQKSKLNCYSFNYKRFPFHDVLLKSNWKLLFNTTVVNPRHEDPVFQNFIFQSAVSACFFTLLPSMNNGTYWTPDGCLAEQLGLCLNWVTTPQHSEGIYI